MYKLTFANSHDRHALYASDLEVLRDYAYRADLTPFDYKITKIEQPEEESQAA